MIDTEILLEQLDDRAMLLTGLDAAIIGYSDYDQMTVYSYELLIAALQENSPEWTEEDALEWYDYNIGSMLGMGQFHVVVTEVL